MKKTRAESYDSRVHSAFTRHAGNVQFNIMDLGKILDAGRDAIRECRDLDDAVIEAVEKYRQN